MVVVGGIVQVIEVLIWVSGTPKLVHHLDVEIVILVDAGAGLIGSNALGWRLHVKTMGFVRILPGRPLGNSSGAWRKSCHYPEWAH